MKIIKQFNDNNLDEENGLKLNNLDEIDFEE